MNKWLFILLLFSYSFCNAQTEDEARIARFDSLWSVWIDESAPDSSRADALRDWTWHSKLFSQPDSGFYYAQVLYDFANQTNDGKGMAVALNIQGVSHAVRRDNDKALEYFNKCADMYEKSNDLVGVGATLNNIGNIYLNIGKDSAAIETFKRSIAIREKIDDKHGIASCYNNLGLIYTRQGDFISATEVYAKCLRLAEEIENAELIASSKTNFGNIYRLQGDYENGMKYCKESYEGYKAIGHTSSALRALTLVGLCYQSIGDYETALKYHIQVRDEAKAFGDIMEVGTGLSNISSIYILIVDEAGNDLSSAQIDSLLNLSAAAADSAYKIGVEINDLDAQAGGSSSLSNIAYKRGQYAKAREYAERALQASQKAGEVDNIRDAAKLLYSAGRAMNNFELALINYELHIEMRDSLEKEENQRVVIQQQYQYAYEKKHLADSLDFALQTKIDELAHDAELEQEAQQRYILYAGLGFLIALGAVIFRGYQRKKQDNIIITQQKKEVEKQKHEADVQRHIAEERNMEILDSINYAKRIQEAILPPTRLVKEWLPNSFVLYKPKDIVAGDFYWLDSIDNHIIFAAADCTGHGVPGAMVSVVCNNAMNRAVREFGLRDPGEILDKTREVVTEQFEKSEEDVKDGMDIALCSLAQNPQSSSSHSLLKYSGANNPLWIIRKNEGLPEDISAEFGETAILHAGEQHSIIEIKATKQPIGKVENPSHYTTHTFQLKAEDAIYIFSDGYVDQFGGKKGKKLKSKAFRELLLAIQDRSMEEQRKVINEAFEKWKGDLEQVDDVCVIGVRL